MTAPIGVQLYSVRDALQADFSGTLRRLAAMGYAGVEFAGIYGESPASAAALCRELGLSICAAHLGLPANGGAEIYDTAHTLGIDIIVCPWLPPERFQSADSVRAVCDELNAAAEKAQANGLRFAYHNHDFEFVHHDSFGTPFEIMRRELSPTIEFELDAYWVRIAGGDAAAVLREQGKRVSLLHIKDGTGIKDQPFLALGSGVMEIPQVIEASQAEWHIVELDYTATDMLTALEQSLAYLKSQVGT
jgi:sugar phosphate isomerase/epimerase